MLSSGLERPPISTKNWYDYVAHPGAPASLVSPPALAAGISSPSPLQAAIACLFIWSQQWPSLDYKGNILQWLWESLLPSITEGFLFPDLDTP